MKGKQLEAYEDMRGQVLKIGVRYKLSKKDMKEALKQLKEDIEEVYSQVMIM